MVKDSYICDGLKNFSYDFIMYAKRIDKSNNLWTNSSLFNKIIN